MFRTACLKLAYVLIRDSVTDLIYWIVQVLKEDLERLAVSTQNAGLMEPVKL